MRAVIMAGGKGTRLRSIASDIPKPMVPILGKPILEYQIESLKKSGITKITLIIGHLGHLIKDYFEAGARWDVDIDYIIEDIPLGTAGALYYLKATLKEDFLLVFGDLVLDVDWLRFMNFHQRTGGVITLFGHPNSHPYDSDLIVADEKDCVIEIDKKNNIREYYYHNFVNAGLYCVSPRLLEKITAPQKMDLENQLIAEQIPVGTVYVYKSTEYVKDMGTPDRYDSVTADFMKGIVQSRNLRNLQKCIFIDRDGTINELKGFLNSADQFDIMSGVVDAIKRINGSEYLSIIVTNQPVIARGECSVHELNKIHKKLETVLGQSGAYIDDLLYCPHHPDQGFEGEVPELKIKCLCRKPGTGMIDLAKTTYHIDIKNSWLIGDSTIDIQTGKNAALKTILVKTGEAGQDGRYPAEPDVICSDLNTAVDYILGGIE